MYNDLNNILPEFESSIINFKDILEKKLFNSSTLIASSLSNSLLSTYLHSIRLIKPASKDHYKGKGIKVTSELL